MPRLLRVHFASIGHPDARLAPLTLDFRHGDGTGADSLLWLRNGGGKSSILNLFFSVFRPDRRDFLGAKAEAKVRHLQDYVKDSDLAFVLTEWDVDPPDTPDLYTRRTPQTRLVGQMLAWRGQQRSSDSSRLRRLFFSCRLNETLRLEDFPVQGLSTPVTSFESFKEWLSGQPSSEPRSTENQEQWQQHLEDLGLDPELFAYQIKMNLREGAADEQFRFTSPREFIDFFLQLAFNSQHADQVSDNLTKLSTAFKRRPGLLLEREFIDAVLAELSPLALEVTQMLQAKEAKRDCLNQAGEVDAALAVLAQSYATAASVNRIAAKEADVAITTAANEIRKLSRWADGLNRKALELDVDETSARLKQAQATEAAAKTHLRNVKAASRLLALRTCEAEVLALQDALRRSELALEPLRLEASHAGSRLISALNGLLASERTRLDALKSALTDTTTQLRAVRQEQGHLSKRQGINSEVQKSLQSQSDKRDQARDQLIKAGSVESREQVEAAHQRWSSTAHTLSQQLEGFANEQERLQTLRDTTQKAIQDATSTLRVLQGDAKNHTRLLDEAREQQDHILMAQAYREVEGLGNTAAALTPHTRRALEAEAERRRHDVIQLKVDRTEDDRALDALARTGFLPPSRDTEVVLERLRERKISAHSGLGYLIENCQESERKTVLLRDPARYGGVIVLTPHALAQVQALPTPWAGLRSPLQVSLPKLELSDAAPDTTVLPPESAGTFDRDAAEVERVRLEDRRSSFDQRESRLSREEQTYQTLANTLGHYLERFPEGRLETLDLELQELTANIQAAHTQLQDLEQTLDTATRSSRNLVLRQKQLQAEKTQVDKRIEQLDRFLEQHEKHIAQVRAQLEAARAEERTLAQQAEQLVLTLARLEQSHAGQTQVLSHAEHELRTLEREVAGVTLRTESLPESGISLEEARAQYKKLLDLYERKTSENQLQWQLGEAQKRLEQEVSDFSLASQGLNRPEIEALLPLPPLALELADERVQVAGRAVGHAESDHELAKKQLLTLKTIRRDADDLPPEFIPTLAADARALAERHREGARQAGEVQNQAKERLSRHEAQVTQLERQETSCRHQRSLLSAAVETIPVVSAGQLPVTEAEIAQRVETVCRQFKVLKEKAEQAEKTAMIRAGKVQRVVLESRFEALRSQMRERLKAPPLELFDDAARHRDTLLERREVIDAQLADIEVDRRQLLLELEKVCFSGISLLKRVDSASKLPRHVPVWGDRSYLRIHFDSPRTPEERVTRLEPLVDLLVADGRIPGGLALVQRAITSLVGQRGFDVKILKPDAVLRHDPVGIDEMARFSRGQQLTAAILLYCTLAQLRARQSGTERGRRDAGILILDNPIGTCSNPQLLQLQRDMAGAMRVQLVYTTGVEDPHALAILPNVIRLRNVHRDKKTGDYLVSQEEPQNLLEATRVRLKEEQP